MNGLIEGDTIKINLPSTVSLNSLVTTISFQSVSISPTSGVAQNFNNPVLPASERGGKMHIEL